MKKRYLTAAAIVATASVALTGWAASSGGTGSTTDPSLAKKQAATSADAFGRMAGLVAAANKECHLNVITLPPSWANYGKIIQGFEKKYPKIKISSQNPDGSSADEVSAAKAAGTGSNAPDVFDIGTAVLSQNLDLVPPYKVPTL